MDSAKKIISVALDRDLLKLIDKWTAAQAARPSRTAVIEAAVRKFLAENK
jgi:metal-responsive CopG/Arc/MetJ family transcriptional regulator